MNKKILLVLLSLFIMTGCDNNKKEEVKDSNNNDNEIIESSNEPKYKSVTLRLYDNFGEENVNGNIIGLVGNTTDNNFIVTKDNKIYRNVLGKFQYVLTADQNFNRILDKTVSGNLLIENKDGSYTIYYVLTPDVKQTFNAENLAMAYFSGSESIIYTLEDNYLYMINTNSSEKMQLCIDESGARITSGTIYYCDKIKYASPTLSSLAIIKEDGTTYYATAGGGNQIDGNTYAIYTNGNYGLIENVDKIYANGSVIYYKHPIYSKIGDTNNLYVRKSGISLDTVTYTIPLPEGYTTENIKEVHATEEIILVMNDGNIYHKKDAESTSWTIVEELTKLNKAGHIISIAEDYTDIFILCDDNNLYELNY